MIALLYPLAAFGLCLIAQGLRMFVVQNESQSRKWFHPLIAIGVTTIGLIAFLLPLTGLMGHLAKQSLR